MPSPLSSLRILAVDDDAFVLKTLRIVLGRLGITKVEDALSTDDAERLIRESAPYDVIICDLNMPGRDGIELLRGMPQLAMQTAVVILSGEDERIVHSVAAMARAAGLNLLAALGKPPTAQQLSDALSTIDEVVPSRRAAVRAVSLTGEQFDEMLQGGLLDLRYQPKVRASDGEFVGLEAFICGEHPAVGELSARIIVNAVDGERRVGALARFVIGRAVATAGALHRRGLKVSMAINLDLAALKYVRLPDYIGAVAEAQGVPMASIILEVTEEEYFYGYVQALDVTTRLRLKRCQLSIDDYGSGVSSLRQLYDLPLTEMKIDRLHVAGCDGSAAKRAIVQAAIGVAKAFGMTAVAEGVETEAEWATVRDLGVDLVQGYLVARPLEESMIEDWAAAWARRAR